MSARPLGPHVLARIFDTPLAIDARKARVILAAVFPRLGVPALAWNEPGAAQVLRRESAAAMAAEALDQVEEDDQRDRDFAFFAESGIAYIPVEGTLVHKLGCLGMYSGQTGYDGIGFLFGQAVADPAVKGVLMDFHTPGGEMAGLHDLAETIYAYRQQADSKPVWAIANDDCMSAGYWLACSADVVVGTRTSNVGSIGVWTMHVDFSGWLENEGIVVTPIHAGARKIDGWPYKPLPPEVEERFQEVINDSFGLFTDVVARNRRLASQAVRDQESQWFLASEALRLGLIDAVASFDETFTEFAAQLAKPPAVIVAG